MPNLKHLTCQVLWADTNVSFQEYGTIYGDGIVETFIVVPQKPQSFAIQLTSRGYISQGLAMVVFIDGNYQCNRNRVNLVHPNKDLSRERTEVKFLVRQKEKSVDEGMYMGREWRFDDHNIVSEHPDDIDQNHFNMLGTIEVLVLRCKAKFEDEANASTCSSAAESGILDGNVDDIDDDKQAREDRSLRNGRDVNTWEMLPTSLDGPVDNPRGFGYEGPEHSSREQDQSRMGPENLDYATGRFSPGHRRWRAGSKLPGHYAFETRHSGRSPQHNPFVSYHSRDLPERRVHFDHGPIPGHPDPREERYADRHEDAHLFSHRSPPRVGNNNSQASPETSLPEERYSTSYSRHRHDQERDRIPHADPYMHDTPDSRYDDRHLPSVGTSQPATQTFRPYYDFLPRAPYFPASQHSEIPPSWSGAYLPTQVLPTYPMYVHGAGSPFFSTGTQYPFARLPSYFIGGSQVPPGFSTFANPNKLHTAGIQTTVTNCNRTPSNSRSQNAMNQNNNQQQPENSKNQDNSNSQDNKDGGWANTDNNSGDNKETNEWNTVPSNNENANGGNNGNIDWNDNNNNSSGNANNVNIDWNDNSNNSSGNANNWNSGGGDSQQAGGELKASNNQTTQNWGTGSNQNNASNTGWNNTTPSQPQQSQDSQAIGDKPRNLYGPYGAYYKLKPLAVQSLVPDAEEEPRYDVPESIAHTRGSTKQVQPGNGFLYTKKRCIPEYIDPLEEPYARFVFKYRTREQLKNELGIELETEPTGNEEVQSLQNMDKNELIDMLLRAKIVLGGNIPATPPVVISSDSQATTEPVSVDCHELDYLKYELPPGRNVANATTAETGFQNAATSNSNSWDTAKNNDGNQDNGGSWNASNNNSTWGEQSNSNENMANQSNNDWNKPTAGTAKWDGIQEQDQQQEDNSWMKEFGMNPTLEKGNNQPGTPVPTTTENLQKDHTVQDSGPNPNVYRVPNAGYSYPGYATPNPPDFGFPSGGCNEQEAPHSTGSAFPEPTCAGSNLAARPPTPPFDDKGPPPSPPLRDQESRWI